MDEGDKIITFESYYDPMLAHIVQTRLEANGISCFIADETAIGILPYYNQAIGGVKLKIFARDLEICREILAISEELDHENLPNDDVACSTVTCPYCASVNVRFGIDNGFRFHLPSVLLSLFFGAPIYFRNSWHCFNCGLSFQ